MKCVFASDISPSMISITLIFFHLLNSSLYISHTTFSAQLFCSSLCYISMFFLFIS
ncbi:hypothetical protein F5050DRAFT_1736813 [Lentinula boryana]|uniref:Uncharacterized protein n=1 Tax=Lentinula boryana TaxID=40481 RepID=A0ABQ8QM99_9AGAR|nr:hypothetical protein F5050DRAFT_1736813 [Lentinula boryana]